MSVPILSLILFGLAGGITPGPNNMISAGTGAAFGFRRTVPQILGVAVGFAVMVIAVGMGLGGLFVAMPQLHWMLKIAGGAYLLFLAWKIAGAAGGIGSTAMERPPTFLQSALFQWVNPKAWALALGVIPAFTTPGGDLIAEVLLIALVLGLLSLPCLAVWAGFGVLIGRLLSTPRQHRILNIVMGSLVALSVVTLFL
ncbi:threonine/homoserine/homoserine lactone efflux protein [Ancylobacter sp. 3268]|uniref:LysE family translocator n=1 Tax=Ancylobacter sp. 3268 TaxID=2817752 RepID=UPI00285755FF|nr:LysE family translocator [Ancylobacter sp. 3268]MDR6954370.1 threonine/homoserine/homoserine lactone efflux protein [Ancylobacter sp. 3268]